MLLFGDLSKAATMGDRRLITVKVDESRYLDYDQLAIQGTERFDIVCHDVGDANNVGAIVALIGQN
jgi:HK97 family phage major capsid protein